MQSTLLKRFQTNPSPEAPDSTILELLLASSPATLGHLTDFGFVRGLVPVTPISAFAGPALTIQIPHADSAAVHHAMSLVRPGHVVVIDQSGDDDRSSFGGTLAGIAADAGAIAAISNGSTNDVREVIETGLSVFSRGATPLTTRIHGFEGRINGPVSVGGVVIMPGDIVFGDEDGVCIIPQGDAADIAEILAAMEADAVAGNARERVQQGLPLGDQTGASAFFDRIPHA